MQVQGPWRRCNYASCLPTAQKAEPQASPETGANQQAPKGTSKAKERKQASPSPQESVSHWKSLNAGSPFPKRCWKDMTPSWFQKDSVHPAGQSTSIEDLHPYAIHWSIEGTCSAIHVFESQKSNVSHHGFGKEDSNTEKLNSHQFILIRANRHATRGSRSSKEKHVKQTAANTDMCIFPSL